MFCRKCGRDMGDSLFCPDCGTKQRMDGCEPVSEGNCANASQPKSETIEKHKKASKTLGLIFATIVVIFLLVAIVFGFATSFVSIDLSKISAGESTLKPAIEAAIYGSVVIIPSTCVVIVLMCLRNLIDSLMLRSTVIKNKPSSHELLPYTLINGEYAVKTGKQDNYLAWYCLAFSEHSSATKCIFAQWIVAIVYAVVDFFLSLIYCINLINRLELASGLPNENLFGFFVSPTLIIIILIFIALIIVESILASKMKKGFEEIKTKYSK
ncbi:MAG: hypothetical protein IKC16_07240 [Clostridia bacterium]|nr:hypothetical protein [Clostridia bacterium]